VTLDPLHQMWHGDMLMIFVVSNDPDEWWNLRLPQLQTIAELLSTSCLRPNVTVVQGHIFLLNLSSMIT